MKRLTYKKKVYSKEPKVDRRINDREKRMNMETYRQNQALQKFAGIYGGDHLPV